MEPRGAASRESSFLVGAAIVEQARRGLAITDVDRLVRQVVGNNDV